MCQEEAIQVLPISGPCPVTTRLEFLPFSFVPAQPHLSRTLMFRSTVLKQYFPTISRPSVSVSSIRTWKWQWGWQQLWRKPLKMVWKPSVALNFSWKIQTGSKVWSNRVAFNYCATGRDEWETLWRKCEEGVTQAEKQDYLESFVFETSLEGRKEWDWGKKENGSDP